MTPLDPGSGEKVLAVGGDSLCFIEPEDGL